MVSVTLVAITWVGDSSVRISNGISTDISTDSSWRSLQRNNRTETLFETDRRLLKYKTRWDYLQGSIQSTPGCLRQETSEKKNGRMGTSQCDCNPRTHLRLSSCIFTVSTSVWKKKTPSIRKKCFNIIKKRCGKRKSKIGSLPGWRYFSLLFISHTSARLLEIPLHLLFHLHCGVLSL